MRKRMAIAAALGVLALAGTGSLATASGGGEAPPDAEPHLVPMPEISVPIIDGDRLDGAFKVKMVISTADPDAAERVTAALPRLRSASLAASLEFARLYASPMRPVDAEMLSRDVTAALQHEEPGIARILIVEVAARPA